MLYKTHKAGGALCMLIAFELLRSKGLLVDGIAPWMQLTIMYPASSWGSTAPDLDHHIDAVKEQTPANLVVHKVLHLFHPKHRSWQTHSIIPTALLPILMLAIMFFTGIWESTEIEYTIIRLILVGAGTGILSHLILDAFTTAGIYIVPKLKFRLVPKSSMFATGTKWESFIRVLLYLGCIGIVIWWILNYIIEQNYFDLGRFFK